MAYFKTIIAAALAGAALGGCAPAPGGNAPESGLETTVNVTPYDRDLRVSQQRLRSRAGEFIYYWGTLENSNLDMPIRYYEREKLTNEQTCLERAEEVRQEFAANAAITIRAMSYRCFSSDKNDYTDNGTCSDDEPCASRTMRAQIFRPQ